MKYTDLFQIFRKYFEIYSSMLDFGLNGLLSLMVKGPLSVAFIAESRALISCISWGEITPSVFPDLAADVADFIESEDPDVLPEVDPVFDDSEDLGEDVGSTGVAGLFSSVFC